MQRKSCCVNYYPFSHGCTGADSGTRGGFALLRCHVPSLAFWQLMHASASRKPQVWNLGTLNLYLSSIYTINSQIYIWWQFAHGLDARAELLRAARPACVRGRRRPAASCSVSPYAQALSAGSLLAALPLFHILIAGSLWIIRKKNP